MVTVAHKKDTSLSLEIQATSSHKMCCMNGILYDADVLTE